MNHVCESKHKMSSVDYQYVVETVKICYGFNDPLVYLLVL